MADDELLDFCDFDGAPLGTAARGAVHDAGLWHRTLHLWLASKDEGGSLLYQLRSPIAADWPGLLDVTVAGHLLAGENYADAMREAREEIGIDVPRAAVRALCVRREERPIAGGGCNRELQGVHIAKADPHWGSFDPVDGEAAGLFAVPNCDGIRLHRGEAASIICRGLILEGGAVRPDRRRVPAEGFVPRAGGYLAWMHEVASRLLRGDPLPCLGDGEPA